MRHKETKLIDGDKSADMEEDKEGPGVIEETDFMSVDLTELDRKKAAARIGFLSINLYKPPPEASWGRYNDRPIKKEWVKDLAHDFKRQYSNCTEEDSIEIAILPEWLKNRDQVLSRIDGMRIKDVPVIEFTEAGQNAINPNKLVMLTGNHRREAVRIHVEFLDTQVRAADKRLKTKESEGASASDVQALKEKLDEMKAKAVSARFWAIKIYDRGK